MKATPMKPFARAPRAVLLSCALVLACGPAAAAAPDANYSTINTSTPRNLALETSNKKVVGALMQEMLGQSDLGKYFAHNLIQHDAFLTNGRQAMLEAIEAMRQLSPAQTLTVKHMLADRDLVLVHSHLSPTPGNEMSGTNRYDFYRLDRGVIVEAWSVRARAPTRSASGNSAFSDLYQYSRPAPALSEQRVEMNRLLVHTMAEEVFGKRNFSLLERLFAPDYLQHNPYVGNGRAALAGVIGYISPAGSHYRVVRSMADGDMTVVCSQNHSAGGNPADEFSGTAVCDLFRVVDFEMVEHWDVAQPVPTSSLNGNSMFSNLYRGKRSGQ